jgi:cell shape-determining protein MreC
VVAVIERDPGKLFAHVLAKPSAALDRSRHVLLIFASQDSRRIEPASGPLQATPETTTDAIEDKTPDATPDTQEP